MISSRNFVIGIVVLVGCSIWLLLNSPYCTSKCTSKRTYCQGPDVSLLLEPIIRKLQRPAVLRNRTHNMLRSTLRQLSMDLHSNLDPRTKQPTQMLRNLLDHRR